MVALPDSFDLFPVQHIRDALLLPNGLQGPPVFVPLQGGQQQGPEAAPVWANLFILQLSHIKLHNSAGFRINPTPATTVTYVDSVFRPMLSTTATLTSAGKDQILEQRSFVWLKMSTVILTSKFQEDES